MSLLKYIERLKRMDDLISRKATGCAKEFAKKLGISKSQLYEDLNDMKDLGAPIEYCSQRKSYIYQSETHFLIVFQKEGSLLKGGKNILHDSSITGVEEFMFAVQ